MIASGPFLACEAALVHDCLPFPPPVELVIEKLAHVVPSLIREPLRFFFRGYSIWLELEEIDNDITHTIQRASSELGLVPIPRAHVTAIYGMDHLNEEHIAEKFNKLKEHVETWPTLRPRSIVTDIELDGVGSGQMDMAWSDISFATSVEHENLIDRMHEAFDYPRTRKSWNPHVSLAYDNPENTALSLQYTASLIADKPSLLKNDRRVKGISLWNTRGKLADWRCMDRFDLNSLENI